MESQANPVPDHIKAASKELTFPSDPRQWERITKDFCNFCLYNGVNTIKESNVDLTHFYRVYGYSVEYHYNLPNKIRPFYSEGMITGFISIIDIYRDKPVTMKAGKFLRKIFPFLTDKQIDQWVCHLKATFAPVEFELITGKDEESFRYAYQEDYTPKRSPSFSKFGFDCYVKRLDSSCMGGDAFPKSQDHPAIVYAAGDLEIVYAKQKGIDTVGARVLTYPDKKRFSDIYTCDDSATELLVNYLKEKGFTNKGIAGAKIRKIDHSEGYLMPYVDGIEYCDDYGDYFILGDGYIKCNSTEGYTLSEPENYCDSCWEYTSDELTSVESGDCVCPFCLESYVYSELMDEYIAAKDSCTSGNGDIATESYFDRNGYIFDVNGEYRIESDCVEYEGDYYHESHCNVTCFEGVYYHDDSQELIEAKDVKENEAYQIVKTESFGWYLMPAINIYGNNQPLPTMGFHETTERTLRDNYQINSEGVPERLLELPFDLVDLTPELACV